MEAQLAEATKADPENCRAVGEELLKVIHDNFAALKAIGWDGPVDSPVEVVADLLNLLDEAKAAAPQQADSRDAGRWRMASLIHSEMMKHPDIRAEPEAASAYMKAVHDGVCFEAAIDAAIAAAKGE